MTILNVIFSTSKHRIRSSSFSELGFKWLFDILRVSDSEFWHAVHGQKCLSPGMFGVRKPNVYQRQLLLVLNSDTNKEICQVMCSHECWEGSMLYFSKWVILPAKANVQQVLIFQSQSIGGSASISVGIAHV